MLAAGEANDGSYDWSVPNDATTQALVRVTAHDATGHATADASDAVFRVAAQPSGVYFYRFESDGVVETKRLVMSK